MAAVSFKALFDTLMSFLIPHLPSKYEAIRESFPVYHTKVFIL